MDEVWIVSLCLSFLVIVITVLSLRKSDGKSESSAKGKERTPEPVSSLPQVAARYMELTLEDIEKSLERLGAVLGTEPPGAKGAASWQHAPGSESDTQASLSGSEEQQQYQRGRRVAAPRGWAEHSGDETWNFPQRQDRVVAVKALPLPKPELVNQVLATEDWEFEDEEEIGALQCEGAEKQYYHLYWDEESLPDRSSKSVVERADLNRRKVDVKDPMVLFEEEQRPECPGRHLPLNQHNLTDYLDKIEPSEEVDLRRHGGGEGREVLEHPPATSATQNIMEQIEQAVQETLDHNRERSEFIRVRRAPPAPRFETLPRDDVLQPRSSHSSD